MNMEESNLEASGQQFQLLHGHTDYVTFDRESFHVLIYRSEQTVRGTAWRFISHARQTLVLLPVQTTKLVPANPGVAHGDVSSALSGLAGLAYDVLDAYMPQEDTKEYEDVPLDEWTEFAKDKLAKKDKAAERAATELIQARSTRWTGEKLPVAQSREMRDVLFQIAMRNADYPNCEHDDLRYALTMWREITGHDPRESIILDYSEDMPIIIEKLAQRMAEAEDMPKEDAKSLVIQQVNYVAELGRVADSGYHHEFFVLLQSASFTVHNEEDVDLLERVLPKNQKRSLAKETEMPETKPVGLSKAQIEAAKNRRKLPEHKTKIVRFYKGLRQERGKAESARLTLKWIARPEETGGLGIARIELPKSKTIQRWAGDA
jgi:hypothetical protein